MDARRARSALFAAISMYCWIALICRRVDRARPPPAAALREAAFTLDGAFPCVGRSPRGADACDACDVFGLCDVIRMRAAKGGALFNVTLLVDV